MQKRIILAGPSAAGKDFIKSKFRDKGFKIDCSYTTRSPRENEIDGIDYHFISEEEFKEMRKEGLLYEWVLYEGTYYGTGRFEWENCDIFIMESDGVNKISSEDRKDCLVIFVNTPFKWRVTRMMKRGWSGDKIHQRALVDDEKFGNFTNYDLEISSEKQIKE